MKTNRLETRTANKIARTPPRPRDAYHGKTIIARRALSPSTPPRLRPPAFGVPLLGRWGLTAQRGRSKRASMPFCRYMTSLGTPDTHVDRAHQKKFAELLDSKIPM